jgi:FtsP/CotA-like multicopper oxidase with cupredoxin domain
MFIWARLTKNLRARPGAAIPKLMHAIGRIAFGAALAGLLLAAGSGAALADNANPCPQLTPGSAVPRPPDLRSQNGALNVTFNYYTSVDNNGSTVFCFVTPDGLQSPTLHVNPGDTLNLTVTNMNPPAPPDAPTEVVADASNICGDMTMTITSVNVHFHGTNTSPHCHSDEVIHTIINSGQTFGYSVAFPPDEPPGLYWYHPHVHGLSEAAVQGGASGAIVVEGIQNVQPAVAGLPERILIVRDPIRVNTPDNDQPVGPIPAWDLSLNYVPIVFAPGQTPTYTPSVINMRPGADEFWRVVNASADTTTDLQVQYDGVAQTLRLVGLDGVPTGSQDGTAQGTLVPVSHILLPPAGRAEFIVKGPGAGVVAASFGTLAVDAGPGGEIFPARPLAAIRTDAPDSLPTLSASRQASAMTQRFAGLAAAAPTTTRLLYFSEDVVHEADDPDESLTEFHITVDGANPVPFDANLPPAIITTQGSVEDWIIENRSNEIHHFHMHQIHFLLLEVNGVPVPPEQQQYLDTVEVPYWPEDGPYPSVKLRMDFREPDIGDFVYHCHILAHEDAGMMAIVRVLPAADQPTNVVSAVLPQSRSVQVGTPATAFATIANAGAGTASQCLISPQVSIPASFDYQTTDRVTNVTTGLANTPVDIGAGQSQSFVFAFTPNAPIPSTDIPLNFACANAPPAPVSGINVLNLSASNTPVPDVIALVASADPGYVDLPGASGTGAFAVATVNLGAAAPITVSADTGDAGLPVSIAICQTNPATGACTASPAAKVTTNIGANARPTFGIFVTGNAAIPDLPAVNRVFVRFTETSGALRGETSVAVRTK